jgi:hypothetical protein
LKRDLIVFAAVIANYFEPGRCILALGGFFRAALRTPLRRHHVPLVEHLLFFFTENEDLSTLDTRNFDIRHDVYLLIRGK